MVNGRTSGVSRQLVRVFQQGTLAGLSDREVLGRFVDDRDEAAFEALLSRHGPMVLNVCRQVLRDPDDAEDAFQATFLALACQAGSLRIGESLGPWLYRVASRVAARARADRRRRGDRERSGGPIPEREPARADRSDRDEVPRIIHEELGRLPERLRAPIVLCYLEGLTHERAAEQLRCPVGTVRSRLARARALLHGRIARRGIVNAAVGALLAPDAVASGLPSKLSTSLVKTAARIAAGTASLRGGCGVPVRVVALLEGVLSVLRIKQIAGSLAAFAVVGVVVTIAGLAVFPASGQAGDDLRTRKVGADGKPVGPPPADTYVKTYYVGDLLFPGKWPPRAIQKGEGQPRFVDMQPLIGLITSTVAKGTWTVESGQAERRGLIVDGRLVETQDGVVVTRTVGQITPFYLSISLIVRHTGEVHDEVAQLLRGLRDVLAARDRAAGLDGGREAPGITSAGDPKAVPPGPGPAPDRKGRIRRLVDELRKEVDDLPRDPG